MAEKQGNERPSGEAARLWMEQRRQKSGATSGSFAPHTPPAQRTVSTFSSPGSILAKEEEVVVIELTARYLQAGLDGESGPQCILSFGPEHNRRVGDHRIWLPGYKRKHETLESWGREYELWRNRVDDVDLGFLSDVLERTMREAYNNHLLVDAGTSRLVLVLPSLVPHPVLETVLSTLFQRWKYPSVTLLPAPTTAIIAAGLRSGLVVDLGWEESTVTSIYEYREIATHRSTRARKSLTRSIATMLKQTNSTQNNGHPNRFDLELVEELLSRTMATFGMQSTEKDIEDVSSTSKNHPTGNSRFVASETDQLEWSGQIEIDTYTVPRDKIVKTVLNNYLGDDEDSYPDDHEIAIPDLIYNNLLSLSPDVRGVCMSRIVFTGYETSSTLVRHSILKNVQSKISQRGWSLAKRKNTNIARQGLSEIAQGRSEPADAKHNISIPTDKDYVEEKLQRQRARLAQPHFQGSVREVHTLGSWTGASLLTSLKIRGFVEIERDRFLSHGLPTSARDIDISVVPQQRVGSFGLLGPSKASDRSSWTLGGWG